MTERTTEEVLELARQRIQKRQDEARMQREAIHQQQLNSQRPWQYAFLAAMGVLIIGLLVLPGYSLQQKMYMVLHGMCSQEHMIVLGGLEFPICARCSGIYITTLTTIGFLWATGHSHAARIPPLSITVTLITFVVLMGIDGLNSMFSGISGQQLYQPFNELRYLTGIGVGIGIAVLLVLMFNLSLRKHPNDLQPVLKNWFEFSGILVLNVLIMVAIYGNIHILAWPLAIISFLGMSGVLYAINLLLVSLFMGYDGKIYSMSDLAKPATIAIVPTLLLIIATSSLRYWLESQGLM